jgi:hypothetical protein
VSVAITPGLPTSITLVATPRLTTTDKNDPAHACGSSSNALCTCSTLFVWLDDLCENQMHCAFSFPYRLDSIASRSATVKRHPASTTQQQTGNPHPGADTSSCLRKEVIQPHLPVLLPCYDFVPVTGPALGDRLLAVTFSTSGVTSSHDVTGGVYKARERIHRAMADARLLATPTSCRRVAACNPNCDRLCLDWLRLAAWRPIVPTIVACV